MKFIDEAIVHVQAGKGGDGCLSFRREKFIPFGGPDGGDGGDGGSIYFVADSSINTLIEFRYQRTREAQNGRPGSGNQRSGKSAPDLVIPVPVGTTVYDATTNELIGDLTEVGQKLCVAKGGFHGLGNTRYKSSTNRAPRQTSRGTPGEARDLRLELKLLADVGLLGLPNAGKSTFISVISNATPKIADYPFTTLYPNLGVVRVDSLNSFVVADIPGLIEGASEGAGLGVRFLKHLARTRLLLHLVDIAPIDETDPVASVKTIVNELKAFNPELAEKERWLVFTKMDVLPSDEALQKVREYVKKLRWKGRVFSISSVNHEGLKEICYAVNDFLKTSV